MKLNSIEMKTTHNRKTDLEVVIADGFYENFNSIVKVNGDKWMAVTYCIDGIMNVGLSSRIEIGDGSSFVIQDHGLFPSTETEFRNALQNVASQIDKVL